jgi:hypothetical protein
MGGMFMDRPRHFFGLEYVGVKRGVAEHLLVSWELLGVFQALHTGSMNHELGQHGTMGVLRINDIHLKSVF